LVILGNLFKAVDRIERLEEPETHVVGEEADRAVGEEEIRSPRVPAPESPRVLQLAEPPGPAVLLLADGVIDMEPIIEQHALDASMRPGTPVGTIGARYLVLARFADGDGVARAVFDVGDPRRAVGAGNADD